MSASPITIDGDLCRVTFSRFDLASYQLFLKTKTLPESQVSFSWESDTYELTTPVRFASRLGADIAPIERARLPIAEHLFDYQRWALGLALEAKRFSLWLDTGLGKTMCYLEYARQVHAMTGGRVLILAPLAVLHQIQQEAERFYGSELIPSIIPTRDGLIRWCVEGPEPFALCNYEKLIPGLIPELRYLAGLIADESGILKTGGGVIKWNLIKSARGIEYKLSCTATPAPNEAMEYASQAAFLEKLRTERDILWTWFTRDKRGAWTVKPHAKQMFYTFMASWSLYLRDPAHFGFADILSSLPDPEIIEESIPMTDQQRQLRSETLTLSKTGLFADDASAVVRGKLLQLARGFRYVGTGSKRSAEPVASHKPGRVVEIVQGEVAEGRPTLVWTTFDEEGALLSQLLDATPHAVLSGKDSDEQRQQKLASFRAGELAVLISKAQLIGYGLNLQFVRSMVFSGFDDSFERAYQSIRRAYRFGQTEVVRVYFPYVRELEGMVFDNLRRKELRFMEEVAAQEAHYRTALAEQMA